MKVKVIISALVLIAAGLLYLAPVSAEIGEKDFNAAMKKYLATEQGQEAIGNAMQSYVQKMQAKARQKQEEEMFKNPKKVDIAEHDFFKGPKDAKIVIAEFSEYACPYCARGAQTMDQVVKAYPKDVKLVFKHSPLPMHKHAQAASAASIAAGKQGKFWEMHDALFANQKGFTNSVAPEAAQAYFESEAKKLSLDMAKFKKDMASQETAAQIKQDVEQGKKLGVRGTPGFFINGVSVRGARPFPDFKTIIDKVMADMKK